MGIRCGVQLSTASGSLKKCIAENTDESGTLPQTFIIAPGGIGDNAAAPQRSSLLAAEPEDVGAVCCCQ